MSKLIPAVTLMLFGAISVIAQPTEGSGTLPQPLTKALSQAKVDQKSVLLEIFSYNSVESKLLRDNILTNAAVKEAIGDHWLIAAFELEREPELCSRYRINRAPTLLLLRADGTEIDRLAGDIKSNSLVALLTAGASGQSPLDAMVSLAATADAPIEAHVKLADAYLKRSQLESAVGELAICLDLAMASGSNRKSLHYVVNRLAFLCPTVPAAQEALLSRRDRLGNEPSPKLDTVQLLFTLNEALNVPERNLEYYLRLPIRSHLRRHLFAKVFPQLVQAQHYTEAAGTIDLETYVNSAYLMRGAAGSDTVPGHDRLEKYARNRLVATATAAVEALLATDALEKAKRIAGRLIETYDSSDTRQRLCEAARRSSASSAVNYISWVEAYPATKEPDTAK